MSKREPNYFCHSLFYPVLPSEQSYLNFAPHPFAFSALLFPLCSWEHCFDVIPKATFPSSDLVGPVGCTCKRLGIGDRVLDISSPAISLFWHYVSRGGCIQMTNMLTRAATSPWFHLLPLKGLGLKWVPSFCSH